MKGTGVAYDPTLTSFIIVGLVGGVAVVMSVAPGWEASHELARATDDWTLPVVTRTYGNDARASQRLSREGAILEGHGYRVALRREERTAVTVGDGRSRLTIVITYRLS
ncbi:MAG: hypothetical protein AB1736_15545 [Chloroflexota bacterium]